MRMLKLLIPILLLACGVNAQQGPQSSYSPQLISYGGVPTGVCSIYQQAVNTSNGDFYVCNMNGNATIGTWLKASGGGIASVSSLPATCTPGVTAPVNLTVAPYGVYYCITTNTWSNNASDSKIYAIDPTDVAYGVKFDGKLDVACSWTNGANPVAVTCPTVVYTALDSVNKKCFGIAGGLPSAPLGNFTYTGAHTGTCTGTATSTVSGTGAFIVCTDDTPAWDNVKAAFQAFPKGGSILLPAGYSCTSKSQVDWLTAAQGAGGPAIGEWGGIYVTGKGSMLSQIVPMPNFDFTTCTPNNVCFGTATTNAGGTNFAHWGINGLGQSNVGGCGGGGKIMAYGQNISRFTDFIITDWIVGCASATTCLYVGGQGDIIDGWSFVDSCGSTALDVASSDIAIFDAYSRAGALTGNTALNINAGLGICSSSFGSTYGPSTPFDLVTMANNSCLNSFGDTFEGAGGTQTFSIDMSGATLNLFGSTILVSSATSTNSAFYFRSGTNVVRATDTIIQGGTAQGMFNGAVTGSFTDLGGNTFTSITGTNVNTFGSASASGNLVVAGNLVPSANWGTGAAISAPSGDQQKFSFTLTNGSAAVGANPTIAFTFPNATGFLRAPICTVQQGAGGTQTVTAATLFLTPSASSRTGVTLTYNGTPTANLTEFYQGDCH